MRSEDAAAEPREALREVRQRRGVVQVEVRDEHDVNLGGRDFAKPGQRLQAVEGWQHAAVQHDRFALVPQNEARAADLCAVLCSGVWSRGSGRDLVD